MDKGERIMIDNFTYNTPTKLIFGKGVIKSGFFLTMVLPC